MKYLFLILLLISESLWAQTSLEEILLQQDKYLSQHNYQAVIDVSDKILIESTSYTDTNQVMLFFTNNAEALLALDNFELTINYSLKALELLKKSKFNSDYIKAKVLSLLGRSYKRISNFPEAEKYFVEELKIIDAHPEYNDEFVLYSLQSYGRVLQSIVKYDEAVNIFNRAVILSREPQLNAKMMTINCQDCLAQVYAQQGKKAQAEELLLAILSENEHLIKENNFTISRVLNDLSDLYTRQKKYSLAEKYLLMYANIITNTFDSASSEFAFCQFFLGRLYSKIGQHQKAETLLLDCLRIRKNLSQVNDIQMSHTYYQLGANASRMKQYNQAEAYLMKSLKIREERLGPFHPNVFQTLQQLAENYSTMGEYSKALEFYERTQKAQAEFFDYIFAITSENMKLSYISMYSPINQALLSFALNQQTDQSLSAAYQMVLNGKNLVVNELMIDNEIAFCNFDHSFASLYEKRNKTRANISNLFLTHNDQSMPIGDTLTNLIAYQDSLEADLSRACSIFKTSVMKKDNDLEDITNALPDKTVLFDFIKYQPVDFAQPDIEQAEKYLAFVIRRDKSPLIFDLGRADVIDRLILHYRDLIDTAQDEIYFGDLSENEIKLNNIGFQLYQLVFEPLVKQVKPDRQIYIAPDALLNLLPFYTLVDSPGHYLIEKYKISYLTSAKDLLNLTDDPLPANNEAMIFADPDYDAGKTGPVKDNSIDQNNVSLCLNSEFHRLRYGREEAEEVVSLLQKTNRFGITLYLGEKASEENLKSNTFAPYLMHIVTHGFYCKQPRGSLTNPLFNSSLIFSGVNKTINNPKSLSAASEDGILTAYEVSGLNLYGCELVTLSACESGMGELSHEQYLQHEGLFGLRRAFRHAGAKSILLSLWKVPDKQTFDLMRQFYDFWLRGLSKSDSARKAMLYALNNSKISNNSSHPVFWGGFMLLGVPD